LDIFRLANAVFARASMARSLHERGQGKMVEETAFSRV
jgi:hypothetical protein